MAYTIEITDGSATYTFQNAAGSQAAPKFRPTFEYEYDDGRVPAPLVGEIETWVLEDAVFVHATQANITSDLETLRAILGDRGSPVSSVKFKRDGSTVREINASTHQGGVYVRELDAGRDTPGQFATHWSGSLVVWGRRLFADSDSIVHFRREVSYSYDAAGLATVTQRGELSTAPGVSAEAKAIEFGALESPGGAYGHATAGPDDGPSVSVLDDTDTRASFESTWKEHGESLPAGVNEWEHRVETMKDPGEETITVSVRAKGPTSSQLRSAVRARKPSTGDVAESRESEDRTGLEWTATYTRRRPNADRNTGKVIRRRFEYDLDGDQPEDARDDVVDLVPGHEPHFTRMPRQPVTITERAVAWIRGSEWSNVADFGVGSLARDREGFRYQPGRSRRPVVVREEEGVDRGADLWRAEATYVFLSSSQVDPDSLVDLAKTL